MNPRPRKAIHVQPTTTQEFLAREEARAIASISDSMHHGHDGAL